MLFFTTLAVAHAAPLTWNGASYTVVSVEPGTNLVHAGQRSGSGTLSDALSRTPDATAAMNSGMYHRGYVPVGLHIEDGEVLAPIERGDMGGNFSLDVNGVFAVFDDGAAIVPTPAWSASMTPKHATQSGPMLLVDGEVPSVFRVNSRNRKIRNAVGVDADGRSWWVISNEPVRFHDLATLFRDELGCTSALYLDGHVSRMANQGTPPTSERFSGIWLLPADGTVHDMDTPHRTGMEVDGSLFPY